MSIVRLGPQVTRVLLVERYLSDVSANALSRLAAESEGTVRRLAAGGLPIRYLGSTAVPADELSFCLFAADDVRALARLDLALDTPPLRIVEALTTGAARA